MFFQNHFIKSKNLITKEDIGKTYANLNNFIKMFWKIIDECNMNVKIEEKK